MFVSPSGSSAVIHARAAVLLLALGLPPGRPLDGFFHLSSGELAQRGHEVVEGAHVLLRSALRDLRERRDEPRYHVLALDAHALEGGRGDDRGILVLERGREG